MLRELRTTLDLNWRPSEHSKRYKPSLPAPTTSDCLRAFPPWSSKPSRDSRTKWLSCRRQWTSSRLRAHFSSSTESPVPMLVSLTLSAASRRSSGLSSIPWIPAQLGSLGWAPSCGTRSPADSTPWSTASRTSCRIPLRPLFERHVYTCFQKR